MEFAKRMESKCDAGKGSRTTHKTLPNIKRVMVKLLRKRGQQIKKRLVWLEEANMTPVEVGIKAGLFRRDLGIIRECLGQQE